LDKIRDLIVSGCTVRLWK